MQGRTEPIKESSMKNIIVIASLLVSGPAFAADTTCAVKGMHCKGCTEMVEGKVCDETKYSKCEVKVTDAKKKLGTVHLVTKDAAATVDEAALSKIIADTGYTMEKCKTTEAKKSPKS